MTGPQLTGRRGIVTGGSSGIGAATAKHLAMLGADVAVLARHVQPDVATAADSYGQVLAVAADVSDYAGLSAAFAQCETRFGGLDFVITCAGAGQQGTIRDAAAQAWPTILATNLLGTAYCARLALESFGRGGRGGDLVLVGSVAGRRAYAGEPAYIASKWGVVGLGRVLRREGDALGVRTTLVEPGLIDTPMTHSSAQVQAWLDAVDPLLPHDLAETIAFVLGQPATVSVDEILLRPQLQET